MRFDHILIGFLLFALFVIGGTLMITDLNSNYDDVNVSSDKFQGVYDKVDEVYGIQQDAEKDTLGGEIEQTNDETWESMTKGSYSAVRMMTGTIPLFTNVTTTIAMELGIPPFIPKIATIAFLIILTFGLVYMIFRFSQN
jgi:hypothetical protein